MSIRHVAPTGMRATSKPVSGRTWSCTRKPKETSVADFTAAYADVKFQEVSIARDRLEWERSKYADAHRLETIRVEQDVMLKEKGMEEETKRAQQALIEQTKRAQQAQSEETKRSIVVELVKAGKTPQEIKEYVNALLNM